LDKTNALLLEIIVAVSANLMSDPSVDYWAPKYAAHKKRKDFFSIQKRQQ
jgi:hypothetical protein